MRGRAPCAPLFSTTIHATPPPLSQANEILHHKLTLNGYLAEFSGQTLDRVTADTDRDFFMSAEEAVEYGEGGGGGGGGGGGRGMGEGKKKT